MTARPDPPDGLDERDVPVLGEELRRYRRAAGLTLRSLAEQVTFDFSYLAQVERGYRRGSIRLVRRCDIALGAQGYLVRVFTEQRANTNATNGSGADGDKPAPGCPICDQTISLIVEQRDGEQVRVWVCPHPDEHEAPPQWWDGRSPPRPQ